MLISLHVKNLALIDEQEIEFRDGLNILSGETGAGKSILIGSVNLALGGRADADLIRTGADYALVELTFALNEAQEQHILAMDLPVEDHTLTLTRRIQPSRSVCRVCGESVSARQLQELAGFLISIHGQHDNQQLLKKERHIAILDRFAAEAETAVRRKLSADYESLRQVQKDLAETQLDDAARARELDLAAYEVHEIEEAALTPGEDEQVEKNYRKLQYARKISGSIGTVQQLITGGPDGGEDTALDRISRSVRELSSIVEYDDSLQEMLQELTDVESIMNDFDRAISGYLDDLEFDDGSFAQLEERLNVINHLKDKYGGTIEAVLEHRDKQSRHLEALQDLDARREALQKQEAELREKVLDSCRKLSEIRKKAAAKLQKQMVQALTDLNFLDVKFEIPVVPDEAQFGANGYDSVEFMISTNPGEALRPLDRVASGGELSRIMLAFQSVLADKDDLETLIFDEIDAGISGRTAWSVSEKLGILAQHHQILCITHLPQIAAKADTQFLIAKEVENGRTITTIRPLSEEEEIRELARMLGGASITDAVLENARQMRLEGKNKS